MISSLSEIMFSIAWLSTELGGIYGKYLGRIPFSMHTGQSRAHEGTYNNSPEFQYKWGGIMDTARYIDKTLASSYRKFSIKCILLFISMSYQLSPVVCPFPSYEGRFKNLSRTRWPIFVSVCVHVYITSWASQFSSLGYRPSFALRCVTAPGTTRSNINGKTLCEPSIVSQKCRNILL